MKKRGETCPLVSLNLKGGNKKKLEIVSNRVILCLILQILETPWRRDLGFDFCRPKIGDFAVFFLNRSFKIKAPRVAWSFPNR
jgi:hypothetical protein